MADENRRLIPMQIKHLEDNLWSISIDGGESYKVEGDFDSIKRALRRIKGKDGENCGKCKSRKVGTYASMLGDLDNDDVHKVNVWKSKVPHSAEEFRKLMENDVMKKIIRLTKNYLVEGNIIPKGTVMKLTEEKIEFLPSDIWEKAKEIEDENERFEFVKKEVGDEFTDEEIKDFLNKNKSSLNESLELTEEETIEDMLEMLEETLKSEDVVDPKDFNTILDLAKKDKNLMKAWNELVVADDKSFGKKENAFWKAFDELCKPYRK